jgi:O-acetyl-ADP-ribose deacetylase (regulator of RNase III)
MTHAVIPFFVLYNRPEEIDWRRFSLSIHYLENGVGLDIRQGDITSQEVDAIVNAANPMLQHGGGLAGMISRRGGAVIDWESAAWIAKYGSVSHSNPAYTHAGELSCKYVIHAVGPVWGDGDELEKLGVCTTACLHLAEKLELSSIAFPAISTGIYHVPYAVAAEGMLKAIFTYGQILPAGGIKEIRLVLYENPALEVFLETQRRLTI